LFPVAVLPAELERLDVATGEPERLPVRLCVRPAPLSAEKKAECALFAPLNVGLGIEIGPGTEEEEAGNDDDVEPIIDGPMLDSWRGAGGGGKGAWRFRMGEPRAGESEAEGETARRLKAMLEYGSKRWSSTIFRLFGLVPP
jgi:hypothetical protein